MDMSNVVIIQDVAGGDFWITTTACEESLMRELLESGYTPEELFRSTGDPDNNCIEVASRMSISGNIED